MAKEQNHMSESDWQQIEDELLSSGMSLRELSKAKDIPLRTLARQSKNRNWQQRRKDVEGLERQVNRAKFDADSENIINKVMGELDAFDVPTDKNGETDYYKLRAMVGVLQDCQNINYRRWDIPLPKQVIENRTDGTPLDEMRDSIIDEIRNLDPSDLDGLVTIEFNPEQNHNGNNNEN